MSFVRQHLDRFAELFRGNEDNYGSHIPEKNPVEGKKAKGKTFTKAGPVSPDHYLRHLHGEESIGIIPIRPDGTIYFAALDVDVYPLKPQKYLTIIERGEFPIVAFRSKSGGLHLYVFFSEPVLAIKAMPYVHLLRQLLGLPEDTEVFPKQTRLVGGSKGTSINLPYFNFDKTVRYAYDSNSNSLELPEALTRISNVRMSLASFISLIDNLALSAAPPCLQTIYMDGGADKGERNIFLFNCATYLKARFKEDFPQKLHNLNEAMFNPIDYQRLDTTVIASHNKSDYVYQCKDGILKQYCNKDLCREREYGIESSEMSNIVFGQLTQIKSSEPYYIWEINEAQLHFYSESDLLDQHKFRKLCLRKLLVLPNPMTSKSWTEKLQRALSNIQVEEVEEMDDLSLDSLWMSKLTEFFSRQQAVRPDQIEEGLLYYQVSKKRIHFKGTLAFDFLSKHPVLREYPASRHRELLKNLGATTSRLRYQNRTIRSWSVALGRLQKKGILCNTELNNKDPKEIEVISFQDEETKY